MKDDDILFMTGEAERTETPELRCKGMWVPRKEVLGWTVLGTALLCVAGVAYGGGAWPAFVAVASFVLLAVGTLVNRRLKALEGPVVVKSDGVWRDGSRHVDRETIARGELIRDQERWWVLLDAGWSYRVRVEVANEEMGRACLRVLGLDAMAITRSFWFARTPLISRGSWLLAASMAVLLLVGFVPGVGPRWPLVALVVDVLCVLGWVVAALLRLDRVVVGADGLHVRRGFAKPRFITHNAIEHVSRDGTEIVVHLHSGEKLRWSIVTTTKPSAKALDAAHDSGDAIVAHIDDARAAFVALGLAEVPAHAFARAGRATKDWFAALRRLGEEADLGFRQGHVGREKLWRLVESVQTHPLLRVSAAIALRGGASREPERGRLRVIASRCASPEIAAWMSMAANADDDEALERLLEEAERDAVDADREDEQDHRRRERPPFSSA